MLFNKKKSGNEDSLAGKRFKFVKGDRFNDVVEVRETKSPWVYFTDDSRINQDLFNDYLVLTDEVDDGFSFDALKQQSVLQGQNMSQNLDNGPVKNLAPNLPINHVPPQPKVEAPSASPVMLILQKQTPAETTFSIKVKAKLPNKDLVKVLNSSFGEEETLKEIKEYVFSQIDFSEFKDSLLESIEKHFNIKNQVKNEED